jgi:hypothetical protein
MKILFKILFVVLVSVFPGSMVSAQDDGNSSEKRGTEV